MPTPNGRSESNSMSAQRGSKRASSPSAPYNPTAAIHSPLPRCYPCLGTRSKPMPQELTKEELQARYEAALERYGLPQLHG